MSPIRLTKIDDGHWLDESDQCFYIGEYISGAGYGAGDTNQLVSNLKADVSRSPQRVQYKNNAISIAAGQLASTLHHPGLKERVTVVPMPCSKSLGHPQYDDRMARVVAALGAIVGQGFDGRSVLRTVTNREAQHSAGTRASVDDLVVSMEVDPQAIAVPLRPIVMVIDDVFTLGASFKAAQKLIQPLPNVEQVLGVFVARTKWPQPDFSALFSVE